MSINPRLPRPESVPGTDDRLEGHVAAGARTPPLSALGPLTILIIDKRTLIRDFLEWYFKSVNLNWAVHTFGDVGEITPSIRTPSAATVLVLCAQGRDDLAVERDIALLSKSVPGVPIVVVSDSEDVDHVIIALNSGARGYIPTSVKLNIAVEALRLVAAGGTFVPASCLVSPKPTTASAATQASLPSAQLTPRQRAVLEALRLGKANKQIAYELNMREGTVKAHVRDIMRRLRARNRTEVALLASHGHFGSENR